MSSGCLVSWQIWTIKRKRIYVRFVRHQYTYLARRQRRRVRTRDGSVCGYVAPLAAYVLIVLRSGPTPQRDLNETHPFPRLHERFHHLCRSRTPGARSGVPRDTSYSSARPPRRAASAASWSRRRTLFSPKPDRGRVVVVEVVTRGRRFVRTPCARARASRVPLSSVSKYTPHEW